MSQTRNFWLVCIVMSLFIFMSKATTYIVDPYGSGDFTKIQDAIDAADTDDVIEIVPDTYYVNVHGDSNGNIRIDKALTLTSTSWDRTQTILDGNDPNDPNDTYGSCIIVTTDGEGCIISNLTIQNGNAKDTSTSDSYRDDSNLNKGGGISGWKETVGELTYNPAFTIKNCVIQNNYASRTGGGIWGCVGLIEDCLLQENKCGYYTGYSDPTYHYGNGGGISYEAIQTKCSAGSCSCGSVCDYLWLTVKNCTIRGNEATIRGGGIYFDSYDGDLMIAVTECDIIENELYNCKPGGIVEQETYGAGVASNSTCHTDHPDSLVISYCNISENLIKTYSGEGAGCYYVDVRDSLISKNQHSNRNIDECNNAGGGLWKCSAYNCIIEGNIAEIGGGCEETYLYDCLVKKNEAYVGGGFCETSDTEFAERCIFTENKAYYGGALFITANPIKNCLIINNSAEEKGGGVFSVSSGQCLRNCTISGNNAGNTGGGISAVYGSGSYVVSNLDTWTTLITVAAENSIIYDNIITNTTTVSDVSAELDNVKYSCFAEAASSPPSNENISSDPCFVGTDDYHLSSNSPCIDKGDPCAITSNVGEFDLDREIRIQDGDAVPGAVVDMGAYEVLDTYSGPIAHWKLDGDATEETGNYNGTIYGGASSWVAGYYYGDQALEFDGSNDYVKADSVSSAIAGKDFTLSAWFRADPDNSSQQFICAFNTSTGGNRILLGRSAAAYATLGIYDNGWHNGGINCFDDLWHHVALTMEKKTPESCKGRLHIDGVEVLEFATTPSFLVSSSDKFSIGQEYDAGPVASDFFDGDIDDVQIYDRILSEAEIISLANKNLKLLAHWKLDSNCNDSGEYAIHGDPQNNPSHTTGAIDSAIQLNGTNQWVKIDEPAAELKVQFPLTISAWVKLSGSCSNGVIYKTDHSTDLNKSSGVSLRVFNNGNEDVLYVAYGDGVSSWHGYSLKQGNTSLNDNDWHHVVGVIHGPADISLYVDGINDGGIYKGGASKPIYYEGNYSFIGNGRSSEFFPGLIDDVRVYSGYDIAEIQRLYQQGVD